MDESTGERQTPAPDDLLTVEEAAAALGRSPRTVWDLARDHALPRYRIPARGKTTLLRWGDVSAAYHTPRVVESPVKDVAA
jgi:excisionase family DNA binding protein